MKVIPHWIEGAVGEEIDIFSLGVEAGVNILEHRRRDGEGLAGRRFPQPERHDVDGCGDAVDYPFAIWRPIHAGDASLGPAVDKYQLAGRQVEEVQLVAVVAKNELVFFRADRHADRMADIQAIEADRFARAFAVEDNKGLIAAGIVTATRRIPSLSHCGRR